MLSAAVLAACTNMPELPDQAPDTAQVILNIKCELRDAAFKVHPNENYRVHDWLNGWNAGFTLTLKGQEVGDLAADATLSVPLNPGTFTVAIAGGGSGDAQRSQVIDFSEKLAELNPNPPPKPPRAEAAQDKPKNKPKKKLVCPEDIATRTDRFVLGGHIGMRDIFDRIARSREDAGIDPTSLAYNIDFVIKKHGNVSPRFAMVPVGGDKTLAAGFKIMGTRADTHSLKVVFTKITKKKAPECPDKIESIHGVCPIPVYQVDPTQLPGALPLRLQRIPGPPAPEPSISAREQRDIDAAKTRNLLNEFLLDQRLEP